MAHARVQSQATQLSFALPYLRALKELDLHSNALMPKGATELAAALPHLGATLTRLNLSAANIGWEGAVQLSRALPHLRLLEHLYLYDNDIGSRGADSIARVLPALQRLERLNLSGSKMFAEDMLALARYSFSDGQNGRNCQGGRERGWISAETAGF